MEYTTPVDVVHTAREMVEYVRVHTDARWPVCVRTVDGILSLARDAAGMGGQQMNLLIDAVRSPHVLDLVDGVDAVRLRAALKELSACADDQQQRAWLLHEDEDAIVDNLQTVRSIIVGW
jgi:hypothetical protein